MAAMAADKAQVSENMSGKEQDEFEEKLTDEINEDLARKMKKDPDFDDDLPQQLANESTIAEIEKDLSI